MTTHSQQYASYLNNKISSDSFIVKEAYHGVSSLVALNFRDQKIDLTLVPGYKLVINLKNMNRNMRTKFISKLFINIKDCQILKTNVDEVTLFRKSFESVSKSTKKEYREFEQSIKYILKFIQSESLYTSEIN